MCAFPPNARFNTWHSGSGPEDGGYVTLTLRPGQKLSHYSARQTEEGWSGEGVTYEYDRDAMEVRCDCLSEGCDCDGPIEDVRGFHCPIIDLRAGEGPDDGLPMVPIWHRGGSFHRDAYAEAAGY
jgi:hypothetical protein